MNPFGTQLDVAASSHMVLQHVPFQPPLEAALYDTCAATAPPCVTATCAQLPFDMDSQNTMSCGPGKVLP